MITPVLLEKRLIVSEWPHNEAVKLQGCECECCQTGGGAQVRSGVVAKVLREEEKGGSYVSHQGCKGESVMFSGKLSENNMPKLHQDELWFCKGRPSESLC